MGVKDYIVNKLNKKAGKEVATPVQGDAMENKTSIKERVKGVLDQLESVWTGTKEGFIKFVSDNKGTIKKAALIGGAAFTMLMTTACSAGVEYDGKLEAWLDFDGKEDSAYHEQGEMPSQGQGVLGEDGNYYFGGDTYVGDWVGDGYEDTTTGGGTPNYSYDTPSDTYEDTSTGGNDYVHNEGDWVGDVSADNIVIGEDIQVVENNVVQYITVIDNSVNITIGDGNTIIISNGDTNYTVNAGDMDYVVVRDKNGNIVGVVDVLTGQFTGIDSITNGPSNEDNENEGPSNGDNDNAGGDDNSGGNGSGEGDGSQNDNENENTTPDTPQVTNPCYIDALVSGLAGRPVNVVSMSVELDANEDVRVFDMDYKGVSGKFVNVACALEGGHMFNLQLPLEAFHLANGGNAVPDCSGATMHGYYDAAAQYAMDMFGIDLESVPGYGDGMGH